MSKNMSSARAAVAAVGIGFLFYFGAEFLRSQQEVKAVDFQSIAPDEQAYIICGKYAGKATEFGGNIWVDVTRIGRDERFAEWWGEELEENAWVQFRFIDTGTPGIVRAAETLAAFETRSSCIADLKHAENKPSAFDRAYR